MSFLSNFGTLIMSSRIIVVEDEPLIALEIEQAVVEAGCVVTGVAHTLSHAFSLLQAGQCDGVVLDANLAGESAKSLVDCLREKGIPYITVSGYGRDQIDFLDETTPLVGKPFVHEALVETIRNHLINAGA